MLYHAGEMTLKPIGEVMRGPVNDVAVCYDVHSPVQMRYTLLTVHDRACVKKLLAVLESDDRPAAENGPYLFRFAQNETLCFVFAYREERRLAAFAPGQLIDSRARERVCINLVMELLSNPLPYPLLYLALEQKLIHIEKDHSVYLTYGLDLSQLEPARTEADCAALCAWLVTELLAPPVRKKLMSWQLIRKKSEKHAYTSLPELYQDIRLTALPEKKTRLRDRLRGAFLRNRDRIFRILLVVSGVCLFIALLMLAMDLIFGDNPFLRFFENGFEFIGTESMKGRGH